MTYSDPNTDNKRASLSGVGCKVCLSHISDMNRADSASSKESASNTTSPTHHLFGDLAQKQETSLSEGPRLRSRCSPSLSQTQSFGHLATCTYGFLPTLRVLASRTYGFITSTLRVLASRTYGFLSRLVRRSLMQAHRRTHSIGIWQFSKRAWHQLDGPTATPESCWATTWDRCDSENPSSMRLPT